ncbi:MAG: 50S ribosomal protein L32 [Candidatus Hydrogenedentes bacterium]|nr:50S ribosomal protein L32 [Candidatus Hydrogenedentota bacterium]MCC6697403.1 50S ribosomal protein L32 [Candidatus Hydrogenedentota bacterium]
MPVPKRRTGKTRKNTRRSHHALSKRIFSDCPSCGERIMPHRVCPKCGHYKDRLVVSTEGS